MTKRTARTASPSNGVVARAYLSPTLVLLAMDWPAGAQADDFLGFAILRSPGFAAREKDGYLVNKIGFSAPAENAQPMPSNLAPIQKFLWWDAGINDNEWIVLRAHDEIIFALAVEPRGLAGSC